VSSFPDGSALDPTADPGTLRADWVYRQRRCVVAERPIGPCERRLLFWRYV
jgi:hypothetical protein